MRNILFVAAVVTTAVSASAAAAGPYVGLEVGLAQGRGNDIDQTVDFTTTQSPSAPAAPAGPASGFFDDVFDQEYKRGFDVGTVAGYQFDLWQNLGFRVEAEFSHKRTGLKDVKSDDITDEFLDGLNAGLNRPASGGQPAITARDLDLNGKLRLATAMANGQLNIAGPGGGSVFLGGGYGLAWSKALGDDDRSRAWQYMIGYRHPVGDKLELGLKYRYFNSGIIKLVDDGIGFAGNPQQFIVPSSEGDVAVERTTSAVVVPNIEGEYRSRSLSLTLTYNFGR